MKRLAALLALTPLLACQAAEPAGNQTIVADVESAVATRMAALEAIPGRSQIELGNRVEAAAQGRYVSADGAVIEIVLGEDELYARLPGVAMAPIRTRADGLVLWRPVADGFQAHELFWGAGQFEFDGQTWEREPGLRPAPVDADLQRLLGVYLPSPGRDNATPIYLHQWGGQLWFQIGQAFMIPATVAAVGLELGANELGIETASWSDGPEGIPGFDLGGNTYRRTYGVRAGPTFRIDPVRPVEELRVEAMAGEPPAESGGLREPELVELIDVVPDLALDIRYASTNNFMGAVFYAEPRAFLQAPAAEALAGVQARLAEHGLGLLIYDAYRPWFATKMFWDATPESEKHFVANPANGSRHNRGSAVDLTLVDLASGEPVEMTGGYDEFTERSYPFFPGGTDRQRWHRALLRREMEAAGFTIYEYEWWHFDYRNWADYPILDLPFESLETLR